MQNIRVYDFDYENIANICKDNDVMAWDVIAAMFDAIREEKIDISEWL